MFRHRTWLPLPLVPVLLLIPPADTSPFSVWAGAAILGVGELVRLWAVRHIGAVSRTRTDRAGPLVETGPFAYLRNPLYLGNIALWTGFAVSARLLWAVPFLVLLLSFGYHAIIRWEEALLESRFGERYRQYAGRVPRWVPARRRSKTEPPVRFSWGETLFSERGTLVAIAVGCVLVWIKNRM